MIDAIAPTAPASEEAQERIELPVHVGGARGGRADGDERDLAEADLTCPAGEEHERDRDDGVDRAPRPPGWCPVSLEHERQRDERTTTNDDAQATQRPLHLGQAQRARGGSGRTFAAFCQLEIAWSSTRDSRVAPLEEQRADHDDEHDRVDERRRSPCSRRRSSRRRRGRTTARKIAAKFSIRPITAAVSARSRIDGPNAEPRGRPMIAGPQDQRDRRQQRRRSPTRRCG